MANYKEIVTKAVLGKGKKKFITNGSVNPNANATTVLGCWIINHNFKGYKKDDKQVVLSGSYDIEIWYSIDNDTKTDVFRKNETYEETLMINKKEESDISSNDEVIVRSIKQPIVTKVEIVDGIINYTVEKELGIELVGDAKVKILVDSAVETWEELNDNYINDIEKEIKEDYIVDTE